MFTVKTDDLIIVDTDGTIKGTDHCHFTRQDSRTLGNRFGEVLLENARWDGAYVSTSEGGTIEKAFNTETKELTVTVKANEGYALKSLTFDGRNVTAQVSNGKYVAQNPRKGVTCEAVFERIKQSFEITYEFNAEEGAVTGSASVEEGKPLSVTVTPKEGYEVESVKFGETELALKDGKFTMDGVTSSGTVKVTFRKKETSGGGCNSAIGGAALGTFAAVAAVSVAAVLIRRKKKN